MRAPALRAFRDPLWLAIVAALLIGAAVGTVAADLHSDEDSAPILGRAWRGSARDARSALLGILGLQLTVLTLVVSASAPVIQSAANQYSPRLVPYYLKHAPMRWALPVFLFAAAYNVAAVRALGLQDERVRVQMVLSGAVILIVACFVMLGVVALGMVRFLRVERILGLVREDTFTAIERVERAHARLAHGPGSRLAPPAGATEVRSRSAGYLAAVDVPALGRIARSAGVRVRVSRTVGDYLDRGEVVGWAALEGTGAIDDRVADALAGTLETTPARDASRDPLYGIRILADVAARALSPAINDAYTARQALHQIRSVLRRLAALELGDRSLRDPGGAVRVSLISPALREFVSVGIESPLRCGAGDPEILDGVLEIALELGLAAAHPEGRVVAHQLIARVLEDANHYGNLRDGRYQRLLAEAGLVKASLDHDGVRDEHYARYDWAVRSAPDELQPEGAR
jgi:uncharacterized membrane protein